jgi:mRNA-degrading endonuclease RelE of RelBE toxin-antitoxin system
MAYGVELSPAARRQLTRLDSAMRERILRALIGNPAGSQPRPEKAGQPSGSESCVAVGQPTLRSVDSE